MLKLILVDDEKTTRTTLMNLIPWVDMGIDSVTEAWDGVEALKLALRLRPDIVLSDVRMPMMNGIELAEQLKEKLPECKVIFLSAYSDKDFLKSAIKLNAMDYVEKPIDIDEITRIIRKTASACIEEKKRIKAEEMLRANIAENMALTNQSLALFLTKRNISLIELQARFDLNAVHFSVNSELITILFKLTSKEGMDEEALTSDRNSIMRSLQEAFDRGNMKFIYSIKGNELIIVHVELDCTSAIDALDCLLIKLIENVNIKFSVSTRLIIGAGIKVIGLENLPLSYQAAVIALQKQFFYGYGNPVFYKESTVAPYVFEETLPTELTYLLKSGSREEAVNLVKKVAEDIKRHDNTQINYVKNELYNLLLLISQFAAERNILIPVENSGTKYLWELILSANTLDEIIECIIDHTTLFFKFMRNESDSNRIIESITNYIRQNFNDETLSIRTIAEHVFLSPNYLCALFKRETGNTIYQYITDVRIDKAKEYLKNGSVKPYEVAAKVGYSDPKYFSKVFKKEVGLVPSEFRERHVR